ncbi:phage tail protein [Serratia marcescens]|uniref:phage tail protein n=1 Tax=Serratia marcescens TaxID=615 RepID=UPI000EF18B8D|nr:phage tail protein [Serratia marcescens]RLO31124.1 phage tail protein [Serratia marcescens]RLO39076.1 phage tail protein [Serratia marcescens]
MSDKKYSALITTAGAERLANAAVTGTPIAIVEMAVGDGDGLLPIPNGANTNLIKEQYRGALNKLVIADSDSSVIEAEMIMPPQIGGFWLRELALYADNGECIAVGNMPETYKPLLAEGSGRFQIIRMQLKVSSTAAVELIADPSVILTTVEDVNTLEEKVKDYTDEQLSDHEKSRNHPDATLTAKGFTQLSNATDSDSEELAATPAAIKAAIETAVRQAWELDNPVGTSRLFNQNLDPNQRWPWSQWEYAGEHLTIRIANADGSDVGTIGGSDTTNITRANLPAEEITVSGTAQDTDLGTKRTTLNGKHVHHGVPKRNSDYELGGNNRVFFDPYQEGDTDEAGEHDHEMELGPHGHQVSGKTDALGQGQAISVVERHKLQMLWHRVA